MNRFIEVAVSWQPSECSYAKSFDFPKDKENGKLVFLLPGLSILTPKHCEQFFLKRELEEIESKAWSWKAQLERTWRYKRMTVNCWIQKKIYVHKNLP